MVIPHTVPLACAVLYLLHEYGDEESRRRQVTDLFYHHADLDYWKKLKQILISDDKARQCYEAALKAAETGTIETLVKEPNYDFENLNEDKIEVYIVSFLLWAEKAGYNIPPYVRPDIESNLKIYQLFKSTREQEKKDFSQISVTEFERRMNEPLWSMTDALLYLMGIKTNESQEKKISFLKYKNLLKRIRPYAEDAFKIKELSLYNYDDHSFDVDRTDVEAKKEKSFLGSKVKPKEFVEWAIKLPMNIPMLTSLPEKKLPKGHEVKGNHVGPLNLEALLHPLIIDSAYQQYLDGHFRDAVLNSVIALFDYIREKTSLKEDGDKLIGKAFSLSDPHIILSELNSESGQSDQKGFMQIFQGTYQGIRNPKAHSLTHDLTREKASQYLVFASLLARRLDEATFPKKL